ncbi:MAG: phosphotransferase family protein [Parahaliea sp.]
MTELPATLRNALIGLGLAEAGEALTATPLTGGVASDIWHVCAGGRDYCVKRALEKLKVERDWRVPTHRNAYEVAWMQTVGRIAPDCVPQVLGHDPQAGVFVMEYLPPSYYGNWKNELRNAVVDMEAVRALARLLAQIHNVTAGDMELAQRFDDGELFFQLRLEPYLHGAAVGNPDLRTALEAIAAETARTRLALVHGDVSPKNIMVGQGRIVLLDAECACIGDPAFDLAFCLNHLLLNCLWVPAAREDFLAAYELLASNYLAAVGWEPAAGLAARAARLLPGLLLARVDGKSPVEYLDEPQRELVRAFAREQLRAPAAALDSLGAAWRQALAAAG